MEERRGARRPKSLLARPRGSWRTKPTFCPLVKVEKNLASIASASLPKLQTSLRSGRVFFRSAASGSRMHEHMHERVLYASRPCLKPPARCSRSAAVPTGPDPALSSATAYSIALALGSAAKNSPGDMLARTLVCLTTRFRPATVCVSTITRLATALIRPGFAVLTTHAA